MSRTGRLRFGAASVGLLSLCLAASSTTSVAAQPSDQASQGQIFPGQLIFDSSEPDQEAADETIGELLAMQQAAETSLDELQEDAEIRLAPTDSTDAAEGDAVAAEDAAQDIATIVDTASGQVRLCFDEAVPQFVRQQSFEAVSRWDETLLITGPVVEIDVFWFDFQSPNVLGAAGPATFVLHPSLPEPTAKYPVALANQLLQTDFAPRDSCDLSQDSEIILALNSGAGNNGDAWSEETDPDGDSNDLQTTLLHELGHGFGFIGSAEVNESDVLAWPATVGPPMIYDLLVRHCATLGTTNCDSGSESTPEMGDIGVLTSNDLWISTGLGPLLQLEAPSEWDIGSSFSHLDEYRYPTSSDYSLMTPYISKSQRIRSVDNATAAVMQAMGWDLQTQVAPLTNVTASAAPYQLQIDVGISSLLHGTPPTHFEVEVSAYGSTSDGTLTLYPQYGLLTRTERLVTLNGITNALVYEVDVVASNASTQADPVAAYPVVPFARSAEPEWIEEIYSTVLNRSPTEDDLERFQNDIDADGVRNAVAGVYHEGLAHDQEAIARLYLGYLSRTPDETGLRYWIARLRDGESLIDVADAFLTSSSESELETAAEDEAFIVEIYESLLGRPPESAGLRYWLGRLDAGAPRGAVLIDVSESLEHQSNISVAPLLLTAFMQWHDRLPSEDEINLWVPFIVTGDQAGFWSALAAHAVPIADGVAAAGQVPGERHVEATSNSTSESP